VREREWRKEGVKGREEKCSKVEKRDMGKEGEGEGERGVRFRVLGTD